MIEVTVKLPDELAAEIKAPGSWTRRRLTRSFAKALRKKAVGELFSALDEIKAARLPPMSEREIQAGIDSARSRA